MSDEARTIELGHPVDVAGEHIARLVLRAPRVRDMLAAEKTGGTDAEKEVAMFANLCEVSREVILELHAADYMALQKAYAGFLS